MKKLMSVLLLLVAQSTLAGPIIGAVGVTANGGNPSVPAANIISQVGLQSGYTSGVTDFDTFVASTLADFSAGVSQALGDTASPANGGFWIFDMGNVVTLDAAAIWNQHGSASLDQFSLEASLTSDFSVSTALGTYAMSLFGGGTPIAADVFSFAATDAQYIRLNVISNANFDGATRINEIAFRQGANVAQVPEPASLVLFGAGLLGLGLARRKR